MTIDSPVSYYQRIYGTMRSILGLTSKTKPDADHLAAARQRRLFSTAMTSALARAVSIISAFVTVPLALNYLGTEQYGIWVTLSSFALLLSFADLGIGNGVIGVVSRHLGQGDFDGIRRCVATAYAVLTSLAVLLGIIFILVYNHIAWHAMFNVKGAEAIGQAGPATAVFLAAFIVAIPVSVIQRLQTGLQQGVRLNVWTMISNVTSLLLLLILIHLKVGLSSLVFTLFFTPIIFNLINTIDTFFRRAPETRPHPRDIDKRFLKEITSSGAVFFTLQVSASLLFASNPFFIAQMIGPSAVASFSVIDRLSSVVIILLQMLLMPLWPAYGEAKARGDWRWIRLALKTSLMLSLGLAVASGIVLIFFGPMILRIWINPSFSVSFGLILAFAIWRIFEAFGAAMATYMNGLHELKPQAIAGMATAAASIGLKFWLIPAYGVTGAVWSMALAYFVFAMPMNLYVLRRSNRMAVGLPVTTRQNPQI